MVAKYERGMNLDPRLRIMRNHHQIETPYHSMVEKTGIKLFIRVPTDEYPYNAKPGDKLIHFGLSINGEFPEDKVALTRIVQNGKYIPGSIDKPPLISLHNIWVGTLGTVVSRIPINEIDPINFQSTLGDISTHDELRLRMLKRYRSSLPTLSDEEIIHMGISIREVKLEERVSLLKYLDLNTTKV